jgi:hypothetical protein
LRRDHAARAKLKRDGDSSYRAFGAEPPLFTYDVHALSLLQRGRNAFLNERALRSGTTYLPPFQQVIGQTGEEVSSLSGLAAAHAKSHA